jgi:hypothetical protein
VKAWQRIVSGGLVVGTLDAIFAVSFWAAKKGVPARRIFQSIAAGVLGKSSYRGGAATVALGAGLHYFIATMIVLAYFLASRRVGLLERRPVACGIVYGVGVYAFMQHVVLPLSNASPGSHDPTWVASSIAVHALLIGLPSALFAIGRTRA